MHELMQVPAKRPGDPHQHPDVYRPWYTSRTNSYMISGTAMGYGGKAADPLNLSGGAACYAVDLALVADDATTDDLYQVLNEMVSLMAVADTAGWHMDAVTDTTAIVVQINPSGTPPPLRGGGNGCCAVS